MTPDFRKNLSDSSNEKDDGNKNPSSVLIKQIKEKAEEEIKKGLEKKGDEIKLSFNVVRANNGEDENKKNWEEFKKSSDDRNFSESVSLPKNLRMDRITQEAKEDKLNRIKQEAEAKTKEVTQKALKQAQSRESIILLKLAGNHMSKVAYAISQKMAQEVNRGGARAVIPIGMTYLLALTKDLIDATGVGAIAGIITGILFGSIISMFWIQLNGGWKGGLLKKKLIKKILIKIGIGTLIESLPGPNILPVFLIINLWSHYDFRKYIKRAKREYREFNVQFKKNKKLNKQYIKNYM